MLSYVNDGVLAVWWPFLGLASSSVEDIDFIYKFKKDPNIRYQYS